MTKVFTAEHRYKLSIQKMGNKNPAKRLDVRQKIRLANLGKKHSEETKNKIGHSNLGNKSMTGQKHSEETKNKMSIMSLGKSKSEEHRKHMSEGQHNRIHACGEKATNYKNGRFVSNEGYVFVLYEKDYIQEHRLIMEKYLNRKLTPIEVVHHINKIKTDNRIQNLVLYASNSIHLKRHKICKGLIQS